MSERVLLWFLHQELSLPDFTPGTELNELDQEARKKLVLFLNSLGFVSENLRWSWTVSELAEHVGHVEEAKEKELQEEAAKKSTQSLKSKEIEPKQHVVDCVFCKIISGGVPAFKIWENEDVLCFLDISPLSKGHMLIIPKRHVEQLHQLDDKEGGVFFFKKKKKTNCFMRENEKVASLVLRS
jgi:hypothetical protein